MPDQNSFDVIVIGAGAAGMMCAAIAGQRGKSVLLIDHATEPGKKILISGGGRCNFTNLQTPASCFLSSNPHFAKSALGRYTPADFIELVDRHKIAWHEKTLGQLFCDGSAKQIVALLLEECAKGQVTLAFGEEVEDLNHANNTFQVRLPGSTSLAPNLVLASGGLSIPKIGATDFAYKTARSFGLKIVEPRPALVPLKLGPDEALFRSLSGVSSEIVARFGQVSFREAALFTHKGLSGPAILQISSYWKHGESIAVDFFPDNDPDWLLDAKQASPRAQLTTVLSQSLPSRLAEALSDRLPVTGELANVRNQVLLEAGRKLNGWTFQPSGSEGFAKAEVTAGGISTDELSSKTMEAKKVKGLYAIGEAVDVTGWLGGYNFQWAWSSGWAAGQAV